MSVEEAASEVKLGMLFVSVGTDGEKMLFSLKLFIIVIYDSGNWVAH